MKILAIDTSTKFLCLGVYDSGRIYEYNLEVGRRLSAVITTSIQRVLAAAGLKIRDIDYLACGLGPGSFTGMRTGIAAVKALGLVLQRPVIGISTLDIIACNVNAKDGWIIPVIDARRNLIYCAVFQKKKGRLYRSGPYMLLSDKKLLKIIKPGSILLGDALGLYAKEMLKNAKAPKLLDKDYWYPRAGNIIALSLERIKAKKFSNCFNIKPVYLYPKECQVRSVNRNSCLPAGMA